MNMSQRQHQPAVATPPAVSKRETQSVPVVSTSLPSPASEVKPAGRVIEKHRQCPVCWERCGGYGNAYSKHGDTSYYRCQQTTNPEFPPCGHTWTAIIRVEVVRVEHRQVILNGQR